MIWRNHKIIFLHIPRTGGTSLEIALSGVRDPLEVEQEEGCWHKHFDALRAESTWPEFADPDYRVVAFVRHPLDLVASQYLQSWINPTTVGFNSWLRRCLEERRPLYQVSAEVDDYMDELVPAEYSRTSAGDSQRRFLATTSVRKIHIYRFERLRASIKAVCDLAGVAMPSPIPDSGVRLPGEYPGIPRDKRGVLCYRAMYERDTKKAVSQRLADDLALWQSAL